MEGLFVTFEGIDGCGKSTQIQRVTAWLAERGIEPLLVREPGGTELGERLRTLVLDPASGDVAPSAEALMYAASRAQLVRDVIKPALAAGRVVIADRFVDSSLAYQGVGRGLGIDEIRAINEVALDGLHPDVTFLLRIDPQIAASRRAGADAPPDRLELAGNEFFDAVAAAYDTLADAEPRRIVVVDAHRPIDEVGGQVVAALEQRLPAGVSS